ncbi:MAG: hypothetical protein QOE41_4696 [Mycobacterium sp.]|jgi:hypothetical protein|nr:hypothetical protein [Mycobacterium sp.]MDT5135385.1 hypothetical protein [Mycobacterium sp.]
MTGIDPARPEPQPDAGIDDLQSDIEQTRRELGQTVAALSAKLDVKERARQKAVETRTRITAATRDQRTPVVAALVGVVMIVGLVVWVRRR